MTKKTLSTSIALKQVNYSVNNRIPNIILIASYFDSKPTKLKLPQSNTAKTDRVYDYKNRSERNQLIETLQQQLGQFDFLKASRRSSA